MLDLKKFKEKRILVIGDVMLDETLTGEVNRISPEAPVPVVNIKNVSVYLPGGASNTANNIKSLGGEVILIGVVGNDEYNLKLQSALKKVGIEYHLFEEKDRFTTVKTRILGNSQGHSQQLIRLDKESTSSINLETENKIFNKFLEYSDSIDCLVLSDYFKGVLTKSLCKKIIEICNTNNVIVIGDPKPFDVERFNNSTILTPNLYEAEIISGLKKTDEKSLVKIASIIKDKLNLQSLIITLGKDGIFIDHKNSTMIVPTNTKDVVDVTGAGDTVIATLALALQCEFSFLEAVKLANYAAGLVVERIGTSTISADELERLNKDFSL